MHDLKITDKEISGLENERLENDRQILRDLENAGLEIDGQNFSNFRPKLRGMENAGQLYGLRASRAMMPEHTRSYNLCAPLATASAYTAMGFSLGRSATTTRTTASTSTSSSSSSSTVVQLRQTQQQLTPRRQLRPSMTCVSSPRVSASCWCLEGNRVSLLSVLTLWPLC